MSDKPFDTFCCTYSHDDQDWWLEIKAADYEDAQRRLKSIGYGKVEGILVEKVSAFVAPWMPIECWIRNKLRKLF